MTAPSRSPAELPEGPDGVQLRALRWWDVEGLLDPERRLFGAGAWRAETFWAELAHPDDRHYLLASGPDGDPLGYAGLSLSGAEADVQTIAVLPAAQGRGLGRHLLTALIAEAARRGAASLLLEVRADNAPAIALYSSAGFERIAIRRGYYQPEGVDAWVMRRRPLGTVGSVS